MPVQAVQLCPLEGSTPRHSHPVSDGKSPGQGSETTQIHARRRLPAPGCWREPGRIVRRKWCRSEFLFLLLARRPRGLVRGGRMCGRRWGRVLFHRMCRCSLNWMRDRMFDRSRCRTFGNRFAGRGRMRGRRIRHGRMLFRRMHGRDLHRMRCCMLGRLSHRTPDKRRPGRGRMRSNTLCGRGFRAAGRLCGNDAWTSELRGMRCCGDRRMPVVARCCEVRCAGGSGDMLRLLCR